jgi:hypothetical protein
MVHADNISSKLDNRWNGGGFLRGREASRRFCVVFFIGVEIAAQLVLRSHRFNGIGEDGIIRGTPRKNSMN